MARYLVKAATLGHHGETRVRGDVIELPEAVAADPAIAPHVALIEQLPIEPVPVRVVVPDPPVVKTVAVVPAPRNAPTPTPTDETITSKE